MNTIRDCWDHFKTTLQLNKKFLMISSIISSTQIPWPRENTSLKEIHLTLTCLIKKYGKQTYRNSAQNGEYK